MALFAISARSLRFVALPFALILFTACERDGLDPFEPPDFPPPEETPPLYTVEREAIQDIKVMESAGESIFYLDEEAVEFGGPAINHMRDGVVERIDPSSQLTGTVGGYRDLLGRDDGRLLALVYISNGLSDDMALLVWEDELWSEIARETLYWPEEIAMDDTGRIWAADYSQLWEVIGDEFVEIPTPGLRRIASIAAWGDGNLAVAFDYGKLAFRRDEVWEHFENDGYAGLYLTIHDGAPHILTADGQFWRLGDTGLEFLPGLPVDHLGITRFVSAGGQLHALGDLDEDYFGWESALFTWDGASWSERDLPFEANLYSMALTPAGDIVVGGWLGSMAHWSAAEGWTVLADAPGRNIYALDHRDGVWWGVGYTGLVLRKEADGPWTQMPDAGDSQLRDVAIDGEGRPFVISSGPGYADDRILSWDGDAWIQEVPGRDGDWLTLWSDAEGDIWAAGIGSVILQRTGGVWQSVDTGIDGSYNDGVAEPAGGAGRTALVGSGGKVVVGSAGVWEEIDSGLNNYFTATAWGPDDQLYVVGYPGLVWRDLEGGELVYYDGTSNPEDTCFDANGRLWVVGYDGLIATWDGGITTPQVETGYTWWLHYHAVTAAPDGTVRIAGARGRILLHEAE